MKTRNPAKHMTTSSIFSKERDDRDSQILRYRFRVDVTDSVPLPGRHELAARVIAPRDLRNREPVLLFCVPGGFLTGDYYDLDVPGDPSYSFAIRMAQCGFITAAIDSLGSGASTRPADGFALGVEPLADAHHSAWQQIIAGLADGSLVPELGRQAELVSIGVGHSLGSCLSVVHQARARCHAGLLLYSFSADGLAMYLLPEEREFIGNPLGARANLERFSRAHFDDPYPKSGTGESEDGGPAFSTGNAEPAAVAALQAIGTNLIGPAGLLTLFPGGFSPEASQISVPVFVAAGDHDLHTAQRTPPAFPKSSEVVAYTLSDCWHCHFVAHQRAKLWDRSARWIQELVANLS